MGRTGIRRNRGWLRDARQQLVRAVASQDAHRAIGHALRQVGIERHQLVVQLDWLSLLIAVNSAGVALMPGIRGSM